jgi:hypothetical protein
MSPALHLTDGLLKAIGTGSPFIGTPLRFNDQNPVRIDEQMVDVTESKEEVIGDPPAVAAQRAKLTGSPGFGQRTNVERCSSGHLVHHHSLRSRQTRCHPASITQPACQAQRSLSTTWRRPISVSQIRIRQPRPLRAADARRFGYRPAARRVAARTGLFGMSAQATSK